MSTHRLLKLTTLLAFIMVAPMIVFSQPIDLDGNNGYYSTRITLRPGSTYVLQIWIQGYDQVQLIISPTYDLIEVIIRDPEGRLIDRERVDRKTSINIRIDTKGVWNIIINYPPEYASVSQQEIHLEVRGLATEGRTTPESLAPVVPPWINLLPVIAIVSGVAIAAVIVAVAIRRRPAPPPAPQPTPPPTTTGAQLRGEGTIVMERAPTPSETEIFLAALELPDGRSIPIVSPRQIFGRSDFERVLPSDMLKFISRRHFMIHLEPGGFFIEDLGSANGTSVNGTDIRGKGKVPIKPGDTIEIGGVVKLRFKA